ncbi:MAG: GNAT family N-acetyltransferase [Actinomycetota bacterium]|nr:GNAT family N-acetyltransferase [Actinomycetota bacterium]
MELRPYADHDATATRWVFERAVRITASRDYTTQQIDAWAPVKWGSTESVTWAAARAEATTIVAVDHAEVVGFSNLVQGSLLDMLYVDPRVSRRGVASALIGHIMSLARKSGAAELETFASLTARPLFERLGFVIVEQRAPIVHGIAISNFRMRRDL